MAERMGFEPMKELLLHAFQACALNHSAISPILNKLSLKKQILLHNIIYLKKLN